MQDPQDFAAFGDPIGLAEFGVNAYANGARLYWGTWGGPLGEPMIRLVDTWADLQLAYLRWLREVYGA